MLNWEQCIICQCSNAEPVICMRDVGKDSFVRFMEIRRDEVYSRTLQEMSTMDNFISRKINVVYHRNCYKKYTSKQNCSFQNRSDKVLQVLNKFQLCHKQVL